MNHLARNENGYRQDIDGLRAIAIIAVVINHFNYNLLPSGFLGVDIFFVISGYVVTLSLSKQNQSNPLKYLLNFYSRRIKRLMPTLVITVIILSVLICLFSPNPNVSLTTGIFALFGLSNIYLIFNSTDYFGVSAELNIFTHTWSLGVEQQFYFIFPILACFVKFNLGSRNSEKAFFKLVLVISFMSLVCFIIANRYNQSMAYFSIFTRFWEIGFGSSLFLGLKQYSDSRALLTRLPALLLLVALMLIMLLPVQLQALSAVTMTCLTCLLIASIQRGKMTYNILVNPIFQYIGRISYSLYLWHWGILCLSRWSIGIQWWTVPFQVAIILILSSLSYRHIEVKTAWLSSNSKILTVNICGTALALIFLLYLTKYWHSSLYLGDYPHSHLLTRSRNSESNGTYTGKLCHFPNTYSQLPRDIDDFCEIRFGGERRTFYFAGNSHTDHLRTSHYLLASNYKINIRGITVSSCIFPYLENQRECSTLQADEEKYIINRIKKNDVVIVSNRFIIPEYENAPSIANSWLEDSMAISSLKKFSESVNAKGAKLVLIAPTPEFSVDIQECLPKWYKPSFLMPSECKVNLDDLRLKRKGVYSILEEMQKYLIVYDLSPAVCPNKICSLVDSWGKPLYVDKDHFTDYANSTYIYPHLISFLIQHVFL